MNRNSKVGVAIVAASGYAPDDAALACAIERLQTQGCVVHSYYAPSKKHERFGGTDEGRIAQLHAAAADPDVQIVLALRGGYGMSRILPALDLEMLAASGKLFVGHSDFTALQMALLAKHDAVTFAGPMVSIDFSRADPSDFTLQHFWQCVNGPTHAVHFGASENPTVDVSGVLWGGNLTMLTHLIGTSYMPRISGGILFIEDVNEHPYRIERMLLQMLYGGLLNQSAIVLGDFSSYSLNDYDNGYSFDTMIAYLRERVGVPILTGLPFGHIREKATLAVGAQATLKSNDRTCVLTMSGYPTLSRAD